jgi:hypothetical protein
MQVTTANFLLGRGDVANKEFRARRTNSSLALIAVTLSVDWEPEESAKQR